VGVEDIKSVGNLYLVPTDSAPSLSPIGYFEIEVPEGRELLARCRNAKDGSPVEMVSEAPGQYIIPGTGTFYVDVLILNAGKVEDWLQKTVTVEGSEPDEPDEPDGPDEPDKPDVPTDRFDNIGQRVASWSTGLTDNVTLSNLYAKYANELINSPRTIGQINEELNREINSIVSNRSQYSTLFSKIEQDLTSRWSSSFTKAVLSDYWNAIARGLK